MFKRVSHSLLTFLGVSGLVLTLACQQRQEAGDEDVESDTLTIEDTTMMAPPPPPPAPDTMMMGDPMMGADTMGGDTGAAM